jgi:primosomal protein N' (replication factor Y)
MKLKPSELIAEKISTKKSIVLKPPRLNTEQTEVLKQLDASRSRSFLIFGDTGSGKTRVYVELIRDAFIKNKSVIVLVPEIGLSPQIVKTFQDYFSNNVIIMNSSLTEKNKRQNWEQIINSSKPLIIVGPRSALFVPVDNLGLIIIDEAHDSSYKQDSAPFYQTTRVAARLSDLTGSKLVMGTASPLISDYYLFKAKNIPILRMSSTAKINKLVTKIETTVVDLSDKTLFKKSHWLSDKLLDSISKSIESNEQSLIFLNRRGTAVLVICHSCGWKAVCPNCNISLTYHGDKHTLICHSCGYSCPSPSNCPVCHGSDILFKGIGTKAIETELQKIFPSSRIKRFDRDNLKKDSLAKSYTDINEGKVDIIIGTQIITKGLDLTRLSTVGIVMADQSLTFPDYSSEEKNFQTLIQVMGRVGRGHVESSRVVVQSYNPNSETLVAAIGKDFGSFYENQIINREKYNFPPFVYILKIYCKKSSAPLARNECLKLIKTIRELGLRVVIGQPAPAFHEVINNKYTWQFIVKSKSRKNLLEIVSKIPNDWFYDIDPDNLL